MGRWATWAAEETSPQPPLGVLREEPLVVTFFLLKQQRLELAGALWTTLPHPACGQRDRGSPFFPVWLDPRPHQYGGPLRPKSHLLSPILVPVLEGRTHLLCDTLTSSVTFQTPEVTKQSWKLKCPKREKGW